MQSTGFPFSKIYISLFLLSIVILIGVLGYKVIEDFSFVDSIYMTIITLSTVGFMEVKPLSPEGKIFTIFLIVSGLAIFTYFITQITRLFLDGEIMLYYKQNKMKNEIKKLENHVILCGYGRNGREAARILRNNQTEIVIIEQDKDKIEQYRNEVRFMIVADATRDETLIEAGILQAKTLITTMPDDAQNVYTVLAAKELNPGIQIITRATYSASVKKLKNAGAANVIMPDKIGGAHMAMLVTNPDIEEFIDIMSTNTNEGFLIQEIISNKNLILGDIDCWKNTGTTILGIKSQNQYILNPSPGLKILPGDGIILMGSKPQLLQAKQLFN
ncbi:MAG: potassium channel family protein [Chitinophagales bacterium]